mmetsp:Transcript_57534/g.101945  ORF Transcript_57534/g.101945 Transcript_57534/m.101945 type:complete len:431 (+) Transcript_57534:70-1362(+)
MVVTLLLDYFLFAFVIPASSLPVTATVTSRSKIQNLQQVEDTKGDVDKELLHKVIEQWSTKKPRALVRTQGTEDRSPDSFLQRHQCQEEPSLQAAFRSLDVKRQGDKLSFTNIPSLLQENVGLVKVSISDQVATLDIGNTDVPQFQHSKEAFGNLFLAQVNALLDEVDLPDMDIVLSLLDGSPVPDDQVGIFRTEGKVGKDLLTLPRSVLKLSDDKTVGSSACAQRINKAVFRGATTGAQPASASPAAFDAAERSSMRYFAANLSKYRPDLLDAGFYDQGAVQSWAPFKEALKNSGMIKSFLSYEDQQCYSTVLVIDGNSVPDRFAEQLLWGLPTVFMHSDAPRYDEFWYPELRPDVDFISAKPGNLEMTLEALSNDPQRRAYVGRNGREYVQQHLTLDRLKCYMTKLLFEYGIRYQPSVWQVLEHEFVR